MFASLLLIAQTSGPWFSGRNFLLNLKLGAAVTVVVRTARNNCSVCTPGVENNRSVLEPKNTISDSYIII